MLQVFLDAGKVYAVELDGVPQEYQVVEKPTAGEPVVPAANEATPADAAAEGSEAAGEDAGQEAGQSEAGEANAAPADQAQTQE